MAAAARRVDSLASAEAALADVVAGHRWIIASSVAVGRAGIERLRALGATDILVVAGTRGVGDLPDCEIAYLGLEPTTELMQAIRRTETALGDPGPDVVDAVERFDPSGEARVIAEPVFAFEEFLGRPVHGGRPAAWAELEDKTTADAIWDAADIARAPAVVVPVAEATVTAPALGTELGTVWAADNAEGWHGGGEYTRWVPPGDERNATAWFTGRADTVRVMPFLDGIPCSIHGFITATGVATFRPYEMLILRDLDRSALVYAGGATFWDPPPTDREEMREAARRVGAVLDHLVGYRGPFSIDGVLSADGFRPTELNPRLSRGLGDQAAAIDGFSLGGLSRAVIEGSVDVDPDWLESTIVAAADDRRTGRSNLGVPIAPPGIDPVELDLGPGWATEVPGGGMARMEVGTGHIGTVVMVTFDGERVEPGPSAAPLAAAAIGFAREAWGLPVPDGVPAPDVRG